MPKVKYMIACLYFITLMMHVFEALPNLSLFLLIHARNLLLKASDILQSFISQILFGGHIVLYDKYINEWKTDMGLQYNGLFAIRKFQLLLSMRSDVFYR